MGHCDPPHCRQALLPFRAVADVNPPANTGPRMRFYRSLLEGISFSRKALESQGKDFRIDF